MADEPENDADIAEVDLRAPVDVVSSDRFDRRFVDGVTSVVTGRDVVKILFHEEVPTGSDTNEKLASLLLTLPTGRFILVARTLAKIAERLGGRSNGE